VPCSPMDPRRPKGVEWRAIRIDGDFADDHFIAGDFDDDHFTAGDFAFRLLRLPNMSEFILTHGSYLAIILVLVLTGTGLPIPEEVPIIAAGVLSANQQLVWWLALPACLFGALAGDCVMYWIGFHFGRNVVREHRYWAHFVTPEREAQIEHMLHVHGLKVFFLARFLVGLRSPVYLTAGIMRVPFRRFFLIDLVCATSVIGVFFGLSYYFGEVIAAWITRIEIVLTVIVVTGLLSAGIYFWRRHCRHMAEGEASVPEDDQNDEATPGPPREEASEEVEKTVA